MRSSWRLASWIWRRYARGGCGFPAGSYGHVATRLAEEVGIPNAFTWRFELSPSVASRLAACQLSTEQVAVLQVIQPSTEPDHMEWLTRPMEIVDPVDARLASMTLPVRAMVFWGFKSLQSGTGELWALGPFSRLASAKAAVNADPLLCSASAQPGNEAPAR